MAINYTFSLCKNQLIKTDQEITDVVIKGRETSARNYPDRCFKTDKAFTVVVLNYDNSKRFWGVAGGMWSSLYLSLGRGRDREPKVQARTCTEKPQKLSVECVNAETLGYI